jgi:hypothetical protein
MNTIRVTQRRWTVDSTFIPGHRNGDAANRVPILFASNSYVILRLQIRNYYCCIVQLDNVQLLSTSLCLLL